MKRIVRFAIALLGLACIFQIQAQTYFTESFEGTWSGTPPAPAGWTNIDGVGSNNRQWEKATYSGGVWTPTGNGTYKPAGAQDGSSVAHYNDYFAISGQVDKLQTPAINLTSTVNPRLSFYYTYPYTSWSGSFRVYASNDGGASWNLAGTYSYTGNVTTWTKIIIPLSATYKVANAKFSFEVTAGYGSADLWFDNVIVDEIPSPLTGTKTIKASGGDYSSFTVAINALNEAGVGLGGVIFDIDAGFVSAENCPVITATGTSASTITFRKSGSGANPKLTPSGTTGTADAGFIIHGGDYITFDGIDIDASAVTAVEYGYYIRNAVSTDGAQYNTIKNCKVTLNRANTSSRGIYQYVNVTPSNATGANSYNKYQYVVIENAYQGIYHAGSSSYPDLNPEISNCIIGAGTANDIGNGSSTTNGVRLTSSKDVLIFKNEIRNITVTGSVTLYGLYLESLQGTSNQVYNNQIHDLKTTSTSTSSVIYGFRADVNSSQLCVVYNNTIYGLQHGISSASSTQVIRAMALGVGGTGYGNFYYNSVRIDEDQYPSSTCLYFGNGFLNLKNNIFANFSTAGATSSRYCIYLNTGTLNSVNFNDYYIAAGTNNYVGYYTSSQATLGNWQTATGKDGSSFSTDPVFNSATDLHSASNVLNGAGTAITFAGGDPLDITTDMDGDSRGTPPDIGADEFTISTKALGTIAYNQASTAPINRNINQTDNLVLRIDIPVTGSTGTLYLNSIVITSNNTSDADIAAGGVKLYRTSSTTFSTANPLGTAQSFSGGTATFSSLGYDLPPSMTYLWVTYDISGSATIGDLADAKIAANGIDIAGTTYPAIEQDPAGSRTINNDKYISSITVTQASVATAYKTSLNNEVLLIDFYTGGTTGSLPLNSITATYTGTSSSDISTAGVKLFRTTTGVFSTSTPLGSAVSLSGGLAAFSSLAFDLPAGHAYVWVAFDVAATAINNNKVDAKIAANGINVNGLTYNPTEENPAGDRNITYYTYTLPFFEPFSGTTATLPANWSFTGTGNGFSQSTGSTYHGKDNTHGIFRNLWSSTLTGNAVTPLMGPVTATSQLSFDYRIVDYTGFPANATSLANLGTGTLKAEVSTDGSAFTTIYTIDNTNHIVSTGFATISASLSAFAGQEIYIRFIATRGTTGDYYVDIDNVNVLNLLPPVITSLGSTSGCAGSSLVINGTDFLGTTSVTIGGTNATITANTNTSLTVTIGSGTTGTVQVTTGQGAATSAETFTVYTLPSVYNVSGGGAYCAGGTGVSITLDGSENGMDYALSTSPATVLPGSGGALTFGPAQFATGTYSVMATNTTTGCTMLMTGTATVTVNPLPSTVTVTPPAPGICPGGIQQLVAGGGSVPGMTLLSENFDSGAGSFTVYAGSSTPAQDWANQANGYVYKTYTFSGSINGFMLANSDAGGSGETTNTRLISPSFSTIGWSGLTLQFREYLNNSTDYAAAIEISDDNFVSNITLLRNEIISDIGASNAFYSTALSIPASFENKAGVQIRFRYEGIYDWFWAVDELKITGAKQMPFTWSPSEGLYTNAGATVNYEGEETGTVYAKPASTTTYTVTVTSNEGCTTTEEVMVTIFDLPTAEFDVSSTTACLGTPEGLTVNFTGTGPWDFTYTDGTTPQTVNDAANPYTLYVNPLSNTTYTITSVTDGNGCTNACSSSILVLTGPVTTAADIFACRGDAIKIPVTVKSFTGIRSISLMLNYDAGVLTYTGYENKTVAFNDNDVNAVVDGANSMIIIGKYATFPTLPENDTLITLKFDYSEGYTELNWYDEGITCEYSYMNTAITPNEIEPFCDTPQGTYYIGGSVTQYPVPEVTDVTLQYYAIDPGPPWTAAGGSFASGFYVCLDEYLFENEFYFLDIDTLIATVPPEEDHLNPFYLDSYTSATFESWWAAKFAVWPPAYVTAMQSILDGDEPMFFIKYEDNDYRLIDGFSVLIGSPEETILRVDADYPEGTYHFTGTYTSNTGCASDPVEVTIEFHPVPQLTDVTLQYNPEEAGPPWTSADGSFSEGFSMCLDPVEYAGEFYFLDIDALVVSTPLLEDHLNPFYLDSYISATFESWWAAKFAVWPPEYVTAMQSILAGDEPMFFIKNTGSDYKLIDGFSVLIGSPDEVILRVDADYPEGSYFFGGTVMNIEGCTSAPVTVIMEFHPVPYADDPADQYVCNGSETAEIIFSSSVPGSAYEWTNDTPAIGLASSGTGNIPAFNAINNGTTMLTATLTVTPSASGCTGFPVEFTINIYPTPTATADVSSPITCNGSTGTVTITPVAGTPDFTYYLEGQTPNSTGIFTGLYAGSYDYFIIDQHGCISDTSEVTVTEPDAIPVSGNINYYGIPNTGAVTNVSIELKQGGITKYSIADADGVFLFPNICPGTYDVVMNKTELAAASNATDAAQVNYWSTNYGAYGPIELVRYYAGDVATDFDYIQSYDAQRIQAFFVSGGSIAFDRPNRWTFWRASQVATNPDRTGQHPYPTITVQSTDVSVTANFNCLITGDFNRSYEGSLKGDYEKVQIIDLDSRIISSGTDFELPLMTTDPLSVSAVSLILDYPGGLVEVQDVIMENAGGQLNWAADGGELRIGWNTLVPVELAAGTRLLVLKLRTTDKFTDGSTIRFMPAASPLNELAGSTFEVIPHVVLGREVIEASALGTPEIAGIDRLIIESYPNPFRNAVTLSYALPEAGKVSLEVKSMLGTQIITLVNEWKSKGNYTFEYLTHGLPPGVYTVTIKLEGIHKEMSKTIKIIRAW